MKLLAVGIVAFLLSAPQAATPVLKRIETYRSADVDPDGLLIIGAANGRRIVVPKKGEQTAFERPVISPDRTAVGAQAMFPNCCTSYDIPLQLVVYARGKVHRFTGNRLSIFWWHFADSGRTVAYGQTTVHFSCATHYELRDIDSERLLDSIDVPDPEPCGGVTLPAPPRIPKWVSTLIAATKTR